MSTTHTGTPAAGRDLHALAHRVSWELDWRLHDPAEGYREAASRTGLERPRSVAEYQLELLVLGLEWRGAIPATPAGLEGLAQLIAYLRTDAGLPETARRLEAWQGYLARQEPEVAEAILGVCLELAEWFEQEAGDARGMMQTIGAEILDEAWREDFAATRRRVLVVPEVPEGARACAEGAECDACTVGGRMHRWALPAGRGDVPVVGLPPPGEEARWRAQPALQGSVGLVVLACGPCLLETAWRARRTGLPVQCAEVDGAAMAHALGRSVPVERGLSELLALLTFGADVVCARAAA